jgi:hypothetical protein
MEGKCGGNMRVSPFPLILIVGMKWEGKSLEDLPVH